MYIGSQPSSFKVLLQVTHLLGAQDPGITAIQILAFLAALGGDDVVKALTTLLAKGLDVQDEHVTTKVELRCIAP